MSERNVVNKRTYGLEFAFLYEQLRWVVYGCWIVLGTAGGASAGFMFSPVFDSPWWLLPAYVAAVYLLKRATMKLAEWFFAPDFWWQVTSVSLVTFVFTCLACVAALLTSSFWISGLIIVVTSFVISFFHTIGRVVFVRDWVGWHYAAPLCAPLATIPGWWLLQSQTLDPSHPASTAIAGAVIGFLYPFLTTILLRLMWNVSVAHSNLGTIYVDKQEGLHEALVFHGHAIALKPNNPKAYAARADTYLKHGHIDRAKTDIEHALKLDPKCVEARLCRAMLMAEAGNLDAAIAEYDQLVDYKWGFYPAFLNRARAYSEKGDFERALNDYARAARGEDPALAFAHRADTYYRMGNYDDAIADCDRVINGQSMTCFAYGMVLITRGKCYLATGEEERGFTDICSGMQRTDLPPVIKDGEEALRTVNQETLKKYFSHDELDSDPDDDEH